VLYFSIEDARIDPVVLVDSILRDLVDPTAALPKARLVVRLMPLSAVCYAGLAEILEAAAPLIAQAFGAADSAEADGTTYAIAIRRRNASNDKVCTVFFSSDPRRNAF